MQETLIYKSGTVLAAVSPVDDESIKICKDWVKEKKYTTDDVEIKKAKKCVYVITKRDMEI
jgi:hypothetical protein